jgi:hypothetical protein
VHAVQASAPDAVAHSAGAEPQRAQLIERDHPVLLSRNLDEKALFSVSGPVRSHIARFGPLTVHLAMMRRRA